MIRLLWVLFALLLTACGGGPDVEALKSGLAERLSQALAPGTVSIATLQRKGSQSDVHGPEGETRRIVYFDTELKLEKDFDFGAWDSPGVAGLVSALGAGPKGISGIKNGGNQAGDLLRAHGTALYRRDGDQWSSVAAKGFTPTPALEKGVSSNAPEQMLERMREAIEKLPPDASPVTREVIAQELARADVAVRARLARIEKGYAFAAGPEHGQYLRLAQALAAVSSLRLTPLVTAGGEENLRLLRDGKVSLALAQSDAALAAFEGKGVFQQEGPDLTLNAIGSLYPEPVHVIVQADGPVNSIAALKGRRVNIGPIGSASRTTALAMLEMHGLKPADLAAATELNLGAALVALQQRKLDAVIQVIGAPADSLRVAATEMKLRLVAPDAAAVKAMAASSPVYFPLTIAHGTYPGQSKDVATIAVAAVALVDSGLSDAEVSSITSALFARGTDLVARGSAQGAQISTANAKLGLVVPLHLGAARVLGASKQSN